MKIGLFLPPAHPPERTIAEGVEWDLQVIRWAEELGYEEAWVGEHHTSTWAPNPSPDLLIAQALLQTKRIRLGTGGFLLPYHHPAELAHRAAFLDHLSGGRFNFGIAAGGHPSDWSLFQIDGVFGQNRDMMREALDIILGIWSAGPFEHRGRHWNVTKTVAAEGTPGVFLKPHQLPHPPIAVAGLSKRSETLEWAGEKGYIPMSLSLNQSYLASQFEAVERGAQRAKRSARRQDWRLVREVLVADTDEQAWEAAVSGALGRFTREYWLPFFRTYGFLDLFKHDTTVADDDVTVEYCARHNWIVGSVETVTKKILDMNRQVGGFGVLLVFTMDYLDDPEVWRRSMALLANEVLPRVNERV